MLTLLKKVVSSHAYPCAILQVHDVHHQAAAALRGLAVNDDNNRIVQEGGLEPLTLLLRSKDVEILREVVAALANLSLSTKTSMVQVWAYLLLSSMHNLKTWKSRARRALRCQSWRNE